MTVPSSYLEVFFLKDLFLSTAMKAAHSRLATVSPQVVDTVAGVTEAVVGKLVAMGVAGATSSHPSMEEATTTSPRATAPPLRRASASRAITVKVELHFSFVCLFQYSPNLKFCEEILISVFLSLFGFFS